MRFPVSVVVPTIKCRDEFLRGRCIPSIAYNGDVELLVINGDGNGNVKRNRGLEQATRPYVLFVDDDAVLKPWCIRRMLDGFVWNPDATFVYSDYSRIVAPGVQSAAPAGVFEAGSFDPRRLRLYNYINTTSMIRTDRCPKWDERFFRFQDWDFWLSVVLDGGVGQYMPEVLYELWQIDASVTNTVAANPYIEMILRKHELERR